MAWKLTQCPADDVVQLDAFLAASWEPFAVTETDHEATVWLRLGCDPDEARVERTPRRSLDVRAR